MLEKGEKSYTKLASRKCYHNKSLYPCASVVAKVVRMPRSEVSERHRAGSWVWVVAKSRLEIWESLNCPPTKWGYWPASHENPGTGENGVSPRASNCCCCCCRRVCVGVWVVVVVVVCVRERERDYAYVRVCVGG